MNSKPKIQSQVCGGTRVSGRRRCSLIVLAIVLAGCSHITKRGQSPESESMEFRDGLVDVQYVGDVSGPWGLDKLKVDGLALITELDGTGSDPPASPQRDYLIEEIKTHNVDNIADLLADKNNAIAHLKGFIPAGARKGDRFDIEVQSMPKSRTTSLRGGFLMQARLKPMLITNRNVHMGHNIALARGRVLVNSLFESTADKNNELSGMVLGGGLVTRERKTGLKVLDKHKSLKTTSAIAGAVNARFSTRDRRGPVGVANPKTDAEIEVIIPDDYRHNIGRYFHVILNIAINETPEDRINRLEWLERELHDPSRCSIAAIRLEAMGQEATSALKRGLRSDDPQVRFHAAQALAYMGDEAGADALVAAVQDEPSFRWHGIKALSSLRNKVSESALARLMNSDSSETRYGAFQALRDTIDGSPYIIGEPVGREFMLHEVQVDGRPMIHISRTGHQEIVLFGQDQRFNERFILIKAGLTVKAIDNATIQVQRYIARNGEEKFNCSTRVSDVIRHLAAIGFDYGDVLAMLKEAKQSNSLESQLVIDAVPQLNRSYRNVGRSSGRDGGRRDPGYPDESEMDPSNEFGQYTSTSASSTEEVDSPKKGFFDRIKRWWSP